MSFWENTRKPTGFGGEVMVSFMNIGHRALARWGLRYLPLEEDSRVLDCGCGGGATIKSLLKRCPKGIVKGIDYSPVSVEKARTVNEPEVSSGRCAVLQGSVSDMIFATGWFDAVTAFETVYFWQSLLPSFHQVYRVLKPGGIFCICNEACDPVKGERWTRTIPGMTIYRAEELKAALEQTGFQNIRIHTKRRGWLRILAQKADEPNAQ